MQKLCNCEDVCEFLTGEDFGFPCCATLIIITSIFYVRENHEEVKVFRRRQFRGFDGGSLRIKDAKTLYVSVHSKHTASYTG